MIQSRKDYVYYLESDRRALGRTQPKGFDRVWRLISPDYIWSFQRLLRKLEYYKNVKNKGMLSKFVYLYCRYKYKNLSLKMGFTIPENVFGPGLSIVHYGTIVVNRNARIGANCRIHPDTNIGASGGNSNAPQIGDNVYIAPGVKIYGDISVPNNTAIGANSVLNRTFREEGMMIAGIPAKVVKPISIQKIIKHIIVA